MNDPLDGMGQPVKLSELLVLDARLVTKVSREAPPKCRTGGGGLLLFRSGYMTMFDCGEETSPDAACSLRLGDGPVIVIDDRSWIVSVKTPNEESMKKRGAPPRCG
jgi:hypothetical protein